MICYDCKKNPATSGGYLVCDECANEIAVDAFKNIDETGLVALVFPGKEHLVEAFREAVRNKSAAAK